MLLTIRKILAILAGMGLIGTAAHVNILAKEGYSTPTAPVVIAIAFGVAVAALCINDVWRERRWIIAPLFVLTLICGELFSLYQTSERIADARAEAQAPARAAQERYTDAQARVSAIRAELTALTTTPRLDAAMAAKTAADQAVVDQASLKNCARNCRKLLTAQVNTAAAEVTAARSELETKRDNVAKRLTEAQVALAAIKLPPSRIGLGERFGLEPWIADLIPPVLGSFALNGLGFVFLAFGAHSPRPRNSADTTQDNSKDIKHMARFGFERLEQMEGACASLDEIRDDYLAWCERSGIRPLPDGRAALALGELFRSAGVEVFADHGKPVALNMALRRERKAIPDLREAA